MKGMNRKRTFGHDIDYDKVETRLFLKHQEQASLFAAVWDYYWGLRNTITAGHKARALVVGRKRGSYCSIPLETPS
jgi:hypothetical protein